MYGRFISKTVFLQSEAAFPAEWKLTEHLKITPNVIGLHGYIQSRERPFYQFRNAQHFYLSHDKRHEIKLSGSAYNRRGS